jgi:hypothetical protein
MIFHQLFRITGSANAIVYDDGLKSTDTEPKSLIAVGVQMDTYPATDDVDVQGYHERAKVFEIPCKMFGQNAAATAAEQAGSERMREVDIDIDVPVGEVFKVAIKSAANAVNVRGYYKYTIKK